VFSLACHHELGSQRTEQTIKAFLSLSPLTSSTVVHPDFWFKAGVKTDIPVLLIEVVSGKDVRALHQARLKSLSNTVDMVRLHMNMFDKQKI
jgi:hypothetical protein